MVIVDLWCLPCYATNSVKPSISRCCLGSALPCHKEYCTLARQKRFKMSTNRGTKLLNGTSKLEKDNLDFELGVVLYSPEPTVLIEDVL